MSLLQFIAYLKYEKKYSSNTLKIYQKDIENFAVFCQKKYGIDNIATHELHYNIIRSWIINLYENKNSNRSINRKISSLRSYYKFLIQLKIVKISPLKNHRPLKEKKKIQIPFSKEEIFNFFRENNLNEDYKSILTYTIIEIFYATGIRRAELISIELKKIDFLNKSIKVLGKRSKERIIPILPNTIETIKKYIKQRNTIQGSEQQPYLFLTPKGKKLYNTFVYKIVNDAFLQISTKTKKSPHVLRHTFASHLLDNGANLNAIKDLLGHNSLASTQVYTHTSIKKIQEIYIKTHPREISKEKK